MCIRDRGETDLTTLLRAMQPDLDPAPFVFVTTTPERAKACLLYTSDAADERSSVDLGGRRIIKKKNKRKTSVKQNYTRP